MTTALRVTAAPETRPPREPAVEELLLGRLPGAVHVRWESMPRSRVARALVLAIELVSDERCVTEAWVESEAHRQVVLARRERPCAVARSEGLLHLDVHEQNQRLIALTLREADGELLFAQSAVLAEAGFPGGSYHPPRAMCINATKTQS